MKKSEYQNAQAIAVYGMTNTAGIEILDLNEDRAIYALNCGGKRHKVRQSQLRYGVNDTTFRTPYGTIKLSECMVTSY